MYQEIQNAIKIGYKRIYLIESEDCIGKDNEATVDGVHYNDIGFKQFAEHLTIKLKQLKIGF